MCRNPLALVTAASILFVSGCTAMTRSTPSVVPATPVGPSLQRIDQFNAVITKSVGCRYLLYLPADYGKDNRPWPLLLFLHGKGERGNDLNHLKRHGPPKLLDAGWSPPFIVVSPQCPRINLEWPTDMLNSLLDTLIQKYRVDTSRIYLTGLSLGGYATWKLAIEHPDRFAAIAPICGGGDPEQVCAIRNVPVWAFHGARDKVVPVEEQEALVDALCQCGGNVIFTVYRDATHDSWTPTYNDPTLYEWFLEHRKPPAGTATH